MEGTRCCFFGLGDRAYGPQFCAAARKLAVRFAQLGATLVGEPGYGDDGTPGGGVFVDLDEWLQFQLFPALQEILVPDENIKSPETTTSPVQHTISGAQTVPEPSVGGTPSQCVLPYHIKFLDSLYIPKDTSEEEWSHPDFREAYESFFDSRRPFTAYSYSLRTQTLSDRGKEKCPILLRHEDNNHSFGNNNVAHTSSLLLGQIVENKRLTADDWSQDTRHVRIELASSGRTVINDSPFDEEKELRPPYSDHLPYQAGDVVSILPSNSKEQVDRFLSVLPREIQDVAHRIIEVHPTQKMSPSSSSKNENCSDINQSHANISVVDSFMSYNHWPSRCTLYGWLMYCADIHTLPEREDLWALSHCCCEDLHEQGLVQREKLQQLSESKGSALYADYILREKRNWADVLYDFDSLRSSSSVQACTQERIHLSSIAILMSLLSPVRPREYSIASSPTKEHYQDSIFRSVSHSSEAPRFTLDLCIAVEEGTTPLGRSYYGLCSDYLCRRQKQGQGKIRCWIRPGSFQKLPLSKTETGEGRFDEPVLYIGAGTGIAPLRSLIHERRYRSLLKKSHVALSVEQIQEEDDTASSFWDKDDALFFGCRKKSKDFYYHEEWATFKSNLGLLTAFSQDQWHKVYVQSVLKNADPSGHKLMTHLGTKNGSIYIAGGAKMARAVKDEIVELLTKVESVKSSEDDTEASIKRWLKKLQRQGRFCVEAWN